MLPFIGGSLGNALTCGDTGVQVRFGWNLPNDFGMARMHPGCDTKAALDRRDHGLPAGSTRFGIHVFAAVNGMAVARNILLDGNTFTRSHSVDKKFFVADFTAVLSMTVGRLRMSFANVSQTEEFEGQGDNQKFGSISFSFSF